MDMEKQINMCLFIIHDIFIINLIIIIIKIDINNDELLEIIHVNIKKEKKKLIIIWYCERMQTLGLLFNSLNM
jgi:hypothetical protein